MTANSREGTLRLNRNTLQRTVESVGRERSQAVYVTEPARPSAGVLTAAIAVLLAVGYSFRQMLSQTAPSGNSHFNRQIL